MQFLKTKSLAKLPRKVSLQRSRSPFPHFTQWKTQEPFTPLRIPKCTFHSSKMWRVDEQLQEWSLKLPYKRPGKEELEKQKEEEEFNEKMEDIYQRVHKQRQKDLSDGAVILDKILKTNPKDTNAYYTRAITSFMSKDLGGALISVNKCIELAPNEPKPWHLRGLIQAPMNKQNALDSMMRAMDLSPDDIEIRHDAAYILLSMDRLNEAMVLYDAVIKKNPLHFRSWQGKGTIYASQEKWEEALKCYDECEKINPATFIVRLEKSEILRALRRYQEALILLNEVLQVDPSKQVYLAKAEILIDAELYRDALECCDKAIAMDSAFTMAYANKAIALYELERYDEALKNINQSLFIDPSNQKFMEMKGHILLAMGKKLEANKYFAKSKETPALKGEQPPEKPSARKGLPDKPTRF